jgi:hypothetical protein
MARSTARQDSSLIKLEARAANLKTAKIRSEKEFIDAKGRKVTPEEQAAIQKRRHLILYQLELEGAEIERELVVAYRRKFEGLGMHFPGLGLQTLNGCPFCEQCITSCKECVTSCTACVACSNDVF